MKKPRLCSIGMELFYASLVYIVMEPERFPDLCARRTTEELFAGLKRLDARESRSLAMILAHLSELDERKAVVERAFPSLFAYCTRELGYSEAEAFLRIRAGRAAKRYPCIFNMIAKRRIHVTAVARLYPHLDSANYRSLLDRASRRTLEEIDRLIAELAPTPEKRPVIRTLSVSCVPAQGKEAQVIPSGPRESDGSSLFWTPAAEPGAGPGLPDGAAPGLPVGACPGLPGKISADEASAGLSLTALAAVREARVLFHFAAGESLRKKYQRAKEILWHKYPEGRPEHIFDDALEALLDRKDPGRRIARKRKRALARAARVKSGGPLAGDENVPLSGTARASTQPLVPPRIVEWPHTCGPP